MFDRGGNSICVLQDMMKRNNIVLIIGSSDYTASNYIKDLRALSKKETLNDIFLANIQSIKYWGSHGNSQTTEQLKNHTAKDREILLEYIEIFSLCEEYQ